MRPTLRLPLSLSLLLSFFSLLAASSLPARAQLAPTTPPTPKSATPPASAPANAAAVPDATAAPTSSPVELSPFEVRAEDDSGYQAANTTSGSRLNSRLKDTPAAVSPFTNEFLSDIGATDLESMLAYATNLEREVEEGPQEAQRRERALALHQTHHNR